MPETGQMVVAKLLSHSFCACCFDFISEIYPENTRINGATLVIPADKCHLCLTWVEWVPW